ncbi:response regulator [Coraliomargarita sp. SDUM461004]|uniref:histidine kinase n=1 Tax=Thalassobacterium sedimentorum TaxID=3041258 RepID=A0ABU1AHE1_9BACT|nr:response regulator [Coraliomargarita sp. SDUM461004]MDQ8194144.1 response regulator [Coraliomargarita sp. SDUM461004]
MAQDHHPSNGDNDSQNTQDETVQSNLSNLNHQDYTLRPELEAIVQNCPSPTLIAAADGAIVRSNQALREALKQSEPEIIGSNHLLGSSMFQKAGLLSQVKLVFETHATVHLQIPWPLCDSQITAHGAPPPPLTTPNTVDVVLYPILTPAGELEYVFCQWANNHSNIRHLRRNQQLNNQLKVSGAINKVIANQHDVETLITQCCDLLTQQYASTRVCCVLRGDSECLNFHYEATTQASSRHTNSGLSNAVLSECEYKLDQNADNRLQYLPGQQTSLRHLFPHDCDHLLRLTIKLSFKNEYYGLFSVATPIIALSEEEETFFFEEIGHHLSQAINHLKLHEKHKGAYQAMEHAKALAENANRAKNEFLSVMSHEMRTPLNPIMGYTEILLADSQGEPAEMLQTILSESERMLSLINQILEYSRLNSGNIKPDQEPTALLELCQTQFDQTRQHAPHLDLQFHNGNHQLTPINENLQVEADGHLLRNMINILLENACKYTKQGSIQLTVGRINRAVTPFEYQFIFRDTGIGIAQPLLQKLFKPFSQVDASYKRNYQGIGLGLATCHKLVHIMGGQIEASSQAGVGTCFKVTLPLKTTREKPVSTSLAKLDRRLNILVVEDEITNAKLMERTLSMLGCQATLAANGQIAVQLAKGNQYDLILMDLSMPLLDGFHATEEIKRNQTNQATPIIALTANVETSIEQRCLDHGMSDYISKPINIQSFRDKIARYCA